MAHQALYRNKFRLLLFVLTGCAQQQAVIPSLYVSARDGQLQQRSGYLYYYGNRFSGHVYDLYPNGDTSITTAYYDGREEGWQQQWYSSGEKMEERFYAQGKKQGRHRAWWPDGQPKFIYNFEGDLHEGEAKEWYSNGQPYRDFHYHSGQEDGRQQMWWPDGRLRANYVVKDGEQYGLIGRKLCKNPVNETN